MAALTVNLLMKGQKYHLWAIIILISRWWYL